MMITRKHKQQLLIFGAMVATSLSLATAASVESYTVKSGDTLSQIASHYNTTVAHIAELNQITNIDLISVGQVLELDQITSQTESQVTGSESTASTNTKTTGSDGSVTVTIGFYTATYSAADYAAKEIIAQKESSGSYTATNGQYYGRYQLTLSYLNGDTSEENQERVADSYVNSRYGSWSAALGFWNANGWY